MHILIFTTAHPIDDVRVYEKFCKSFLEKGISISWIGPENRQTNLKFEGDPRICYQLLPQLNGKKQRLINLIKMFFMAKRMKNVDWIYSPDPDAAIGAAMVAKLTKSKFVFDIHENYHDAALHRWLGPLAFPWVVEIFRRLVEKISNRANVVIAVNEMIRQCYAINHSKSLVARNCPALSFANTSINSQKIKPHNDVVRIMHGKADSGRGTLQVLQALEMLDGLRLKVIMIVNQREDQSKEGHEIARLIASMPEIVETHPPMPQKDMALLMAGCSAGLISYQRDLGVDSLPNRLFEYMASGLMVVAPSYSDEISSIIGAEKCGILIDFESPQEISQALSAIVRKEYDYAQMGINARDSYIARHNWSIDFEKVNNALFC